MTKTFSRPDVAGRYDSARSLPEESIELWIRTLKASLPLRPIGRILDLGSGTGRFSGALARHFGCPVLALDPSCAMLAGMAKGEDVRPVQASAEGLPLRTDSIDLAWMSQVFHHLDHPLAAMAEIIRVLANGGVLAIRNATKETDREALWLSHFPEAVEMNVNKIPPRGNIIDLVSEAGLQAVLVQTVNQLFASSYQEYCEKIGRRGLSPLIAISDEAFASGMSTLRRWVELQPSDGPVYEPLDLFIFRSMK